MKYDSLLYGNGLTLELLGQIKNEIKRSGNKSDLEDFVDMNSYVKYFARLESHKREIRNFRQTFNGFKFSIGEKIYIDENGNFFTKQHSDQLWDSALDLISKNEERINHYGAERWLSNVLFSESFDSEIRPYKDVLYSLYNYWYMQFKRKILSLPNCKALCEQNARKVNEYRFSKILTINFDTLLDEWLNSQHLHGKFIDYSNFQELRIFEYIEPSDGKKRHEYPYLFGASGIEKMNRLFRIKQEATVNAFYDTDFFYSDDLNLGNLLIYGIGFCSTPFIDNLIGACPQYINDYKINCVDGHVLLRLTVLKEQGKLNSITVTYHCTNDKANYEKLFKSAGLFDIVTLEPSNEFF